MKRSINIPPKPQRPAKAARVVDKPRATVRTTESVRQQARAHLLAIARLPVDLLQTEWRSGQNRPLDHAHVQDLYKAFEKGGVARDSVENHLFVACSHETARKLQQASSAAGSNDLSADQTTQDTIPCFTYPRQEHVKVELELMAGQHRVAALRKFVREKHLDSSELWWTCELYNKDTLPAMLNTKLRANRRELSLPDSHGQIWAQLVATSKKDPLLFNGRKEDVEARILDVLQLSGNPRFPASRLITLWQNERWKPVITRICQTAVGRDLFNISVWEWLASRRIDNARADGVVLVRRARVCPRDTAVTACRRGKAPPWNRLGPPGGKKQAAGEGKRRSDFLRELSEEQYAALYRSLQENRAIVFPNIRRVLQISKEDGGILRQVLGHVILWLNPEATALSDSRRINKPLLREDIKPALARLRPLEREEISATDASDLSDSADTRRSKHTDTLSIDLERQVLALARTRIHELKEPSAQATLVPFPDAEALASPSYADRFRQPFWSALLSLVREFTRSNVRPDWTLAIAQRHEPLEWAASHRAYVNTEITTPATLTTEQRTPSPPGPDASLVQDASRGTSPGAYETARTQRTVAPRRLSLSKGTSAGVILTSSQSSQQDNEQYTARTCRAASIKEGREEVRTERSPMVPESSRQPNPPPRLARPSLTARIPLPSASRPTPAWKSGMKASSRR
ncbi:uncharacterized protein F5Z01DRAFT_641249 [Emericellopsis atlantica]|uniref:Uncharacterized protein n=1 Tax=Emericellopsis atlantica TaxID=2614577 RepID=A0A9P8CL89_9HYPO|nr:uncharacterized protein F5Z01DRAFT_641249 [Emericellopsis atlantica]KAG9249376.1 hypothetical protein F5Z01DRAFT_641249 [Emericellopsis atlantica]